MAVVFCINSSCPAGFVPFFRCLYGRYYTAWFVPPWVPADFMAAVAHVCDGRSTLFTAVAVCAYGGRRKFSVSRPSERHDSVKCLPRVKKAPCFRHFPPGMSGVQPLPVARRGGPSADTPPLPHHENDMENYFCRYSSTCAAMSLPLARALTTRLAPLAASPATKTFSG